MRIIPTIDRDRWKCCWKGGEELLQRGELIGEGRSAEVFASGKNKVLKLY